MMERSATAKHHHRQDMAKTILQEIIELYKENSNEEPNLSARENLAKAYARKTAIKAGNK